MEEPTSVVESEPETPKPWEHLPGEPNKWHGRFTFYRLLGPGRSLYAAYVEDLARRGAGRREKQGVPQSWRDAAKQWDWPGRALAWDDNQRQKQEQEWEQRRADLRKQEWDAAQGILKKVEQMLAFPIALVIRKPGGEDGSGGVTEVHPARWTIADIARLLEAASKVGRLSVGMETDRGELTINNKPVEEMTDEELAVIAARGRPSSKPGDIPGPSGSGAPEPTASAQ